MEVFYGFSTESQSLAGDVFHRHGSYWGAAAGYPTRHWALRDVYAQSQEPLFWRWVYEPEVRYLGWSAASDQTARPDKEGSAQ